MSIFCFTVGGNAQPDAIPGFQPFLGLAVPYPQTTWDTLEVIPNSLRFQTCECTGLLVIGANGKVKSIKNWPADSAAELTKGLPGDTVITRDKNQPSDSACLQLVGAKLKKIVFGFMPGKKLATPVAVPVALKLNRTSGDTIVSKIFFPIYPDSTTRPKLLDQFFAANKISPPKVVDLKKIFYHLNPDAPQSEYLTITARIGLNAQGELADLDFPIPGQDVMTHQVQMALMNGKFQPARINGNPMPCQLILTFRIFDNITYPISPTVPADSTKPRKVTESRFLTLYYSRNDIWMPPLPRNFANGYIEGSEGLYFAGEADVKVTIDSTGKLIGASTGSSHNKLDKLAGPTLRIIGNIKWYPSVSRSAAYQSFSGNIRLVFNNNARIVFIPEWLTP